MTAASPQWEGGGTPGGGGGAWRPMNCKALPDEILRRPGRKRNTPRRLEHAAHLRDGELGPRREHVPELTDDDVERRVGKGKTFGVAFDPLDVRQPRDACVLSRRFEQGGRQIDPARACSRACRRDRDDAGAGAHVEHRFTRRDAGEPNEMPSDRRGERRRRRKRRPHLALPVFKRRRMDRKS